MSENSAPEPKYKEGDTVYIGNKWWVVSYSTVFNNSVEYTVVREGRGLYSDNKHKNGVPEEELHRLPLSARLARIEAALNLD